MKVRSLIIGAILLLGICGAAQATTLLEANWDVGTECTDTNLKSGAWSTVIGNDANNCLYYGIGTGGPNSLNYLKILSPASGAGKIRGNTSFANPSTIYVRFWFRILQNYIIHPIWIHSTTDPTAGICLMRMKSSGFGIIPATSGAGYFIFNYSGSISNNTWYRLEFKISGASNSTRSMEVRLNGTDVTSSMVKQDTTTTLADVNGSLVMPNLNYFNFETYDSAVSGEYLDIAGVKVTDDGWIGGDSDTTPPTLSSAAIPAAGTSIALTCNEAIASGAGGNGGVTLSATDGAVTATYSSIVGAVATYTLSRTIHNTETVTVSYTQPGNGIEDAAGNDLATFSDSAVTNNSTQGTTYYIDPTAGSGGDGSIGSPFDSWEDVTWAAGNGYLQKRGTTATLLAAIMPTTGGAAGAYITMGAYGEGDDPIIDGSDTYQGINFGYGSTQKSYITIENLHIQNTTGGIIFTSASNPDHILIDTVTIHDTDGAGAYGISFASSTGTDITVRYCTLSNIGLATNPVYGIFFQGTGKAWIHHNTITGVGRDSTTDNSDGISLGSPVGGNGCIIEHNTITTQNGSNGAGIDIAHSLNTDGVSYSAVIRYNTASDCEGRCIGLMGDHATNCRPLIHDNYLYTAYDGVFCYGQFTGYAYNNTIAGATHVAVRFSSSSDTDGPRTLYLSNNILTGNEGTTKLAYNTTGTSGGPYTLESDYNDLYASSTWRATYNGTVYTSLANWQAASSQDAHSIDTNPLLTGYVIGAGSPCINTGTTIADVTADIDGDARPQGGAYDIGADEWFYPPAGILSGGIISGGSLH